jgi:type I restriction enzyme R subunit
LKNTTPSALKQEANDYQIEQSKKEMAQMYAIIGDPDRLKEVARRFCKSL